MYGKDNCSSLHVLEKSQDRDMSPSRLLITFRMVTDYVYLCLITWFLVVVCWKLWNYYVCSSRDSKSSLPLPPGTLGFPFIGETLAFLIAGRKFFDRRRDEHGNIFKTHILGKPTVRVIGAKNARKILMSENTLVASQWPKSIQMLLGEGSLTLSAGKIHTIRKKAILRAFTNEALSGYAVLIQDTVQKSIQKWCSEKQISGYKEFRSLAFELSCRVLLGFQMDKAEKEMLLNAFEAFMASLFSVPICIPGLGLYKGMKSREIMLKKIEEIICEKQSEGSSGINYTDALSLMLGIEGKEKLDVHEAMDVGLELLFAGHETTSSAACSFILHIEKNPQVLLKIKEELAAHGLLDEHVSDLDIVTINKLKYVRNVVKEVLRISPPIGGGYRKALKTFEIEGYQIPKGWSIVYSIRDSHEKCEVIESPEIFNPDRWNSLNIDDREHFFPFGGGKKGCAGKEFAMLMLKVFVVELCRSCKWTVPNPDPEIKYFPVPFPVDNLPMSFTYLHNS